jgi:hypothetical protein
MSLAVPNIVFIVPYRNRYQHKFFFSNYVTNILNLSQNENYEIYFSHQTDTKAFNRGATKNIGFLAMKQKYPNDYKDITFVFNDIDTIPFSNIFDYQTTHGIVKHFYGFEYALGGIVSITGSDFEAANGFPNYWGWGMEDTVLQQRCQNIGLSINRDQFFQIGSPEILHLFDGVSRLINRNDLLRSNNDNGINGIRTINNLLFTIDKESSNELDNIHTVENDKIFVINIENFTTGINYENDIDNYYKYDLRENPRQSINRQGSKMNPNNFNNTNNWMNIPYFPNQERRNELVQNYGKDQAEEIIEYSYENSSDPNIPIIPRHLQIQRGQQPAYLTNNNQSIRINQSNRINQGNRINQSNINAEQQRLIQMAQQSQMNQLNQQFNSRTRIIPPNINKFSPAYARIIGVKPKATTSANIKLGGIY